MRGDLEKQLDTRYTDEKSMQVVGNENSRARNERQDVNMLDTKLSTGLSFPQCKYDSFPNPDEN
eukprot:scaffold5889_cov115-Cylindrotheca_fusiformis.AAC.3